jgi:hypothetical protein
MQVLKNSKIERNYFLFKKSEKEFDKLTFGNSELCRTLKLTFALVLQTLHLQKICQSLKDILLLGYQLLVTNVFICAFANGILSCL